MLIFVTNAIPVFFYLLFFLVPLILFPKTSELFEFNKIVLTYGLTIFITFFWLTKMVLNKKFVFKRTVLDIPLLIFLVSQFLSTITSIDFRTSLLGYYSRYHGGWISSICYLILYWAFVSNLNRKETLKASRFLLISAAFVSIYGVLEHFGIDKNVWVQDVQNRVFSTLGQPNWLAAWLVALIPLTWSVAISNPSTKSGQGQKLSIFKQSKILNPKIQKIIWVGLSSLFFLTLLYTKSRSGIIGFVVADLTFWSLTLWRALKIKSGKSMVKKFILYHLSFITIALLVGTPWTPNVQKIFAKKTTPPADQTQTANVPQLEVGGTASGEIRKIVWQGAFEIWKHYPILGTGVETFGLSYYNFRPVEHNLVSEWDYLYNKAHNEYLNIAANTGTVGLIAYLILLIAIITQITKESRIMNQESSKNPTSYFLFPISLLAGFVSILVTNFFGFSVVPVGLQFFLYPAMAVTLEQESKRVKERELEKSLNTKSSGQIVAVFFLSLTACYLLLLTGRYWYADYSYSLGKIYQDQNEPVRAQQYLIKAIKLSPHEAIFWSALAESSVDIALELNETGEVEQAKEYVQQAVSQAEKSADLSPKNVNIKRSQASLYIKLSIIEPNFLLNAKNTLLEAIKLAPTDAKLYYNLGLALTRTGEVDKAIELLDQTVEMKKDYRNARLALALLLAEKGETEKAKEQLTYILEKINPNDKLVQQELEELQ